MHSAETLLDHLMNNVIPEQRTQQIPEVPPIELPSRGNRSMLGTKAKDINALDDRHETEKEQFVVDAEKLREELEMEGKTDRHERMQPTTMPAIDEHFVGAKIEQYWEYEEEDGSLVPQWCQGKIVAVKKKNKVHIEWNEVCLRPGHPRITEERLLKSKWNKHVVEGWRMDLGNL